MGLFVKVEIPDGQYCGNCRFLQPGTVLCTLFDELVTETDNYTKKQKCGVCLRWAMYENNSKKMTIEYHEFGSEIRLRLINQSSGEVVETQTNESTFNKALTVGLKILRKWCKEDDQEANRS
jgi:hypothetical protein